MLRRCLRELPAVGRASRRIPPIPAVAPASRTLPMQNSLFLRNEYSSASKDSQVKKPASGDNQSPTVQNIPRFLIFGAAFGLTAYICYEAGLKNLFVKEKASVVLGLEKDDVNLLEDTKSSVENVDEKLTTAQPGSETLDDKSKKDLGDVEVSQPVISEVKPIEESSTSVEESVPINLHPESPAISLDSATDIDPSVEDGMADSSKIVLGDEKPIEGSDKQLDNDDSTVLISRVSGTAVPFPEEHIGISKDLSDGALTEQRSLLETYSLQDDGRPESIENEESRSALEDQVSMTSEITHDQEVASHTTSDKLVDMKISQDGKVVLDVIEAIHAAERKQAESDAYLFSEEKKKLKEKYEKELKDARARELMYAEEAAILEKELKKEKIKFASTLKAVQENAAKTLQEELQRKDDETSKQLVEVKELSKAELAAAIAKEKASQIEKIADANLNINALCVAFYARSEEARQSYSVHKLALGTLALEEALSKGLPVRNEVDMLVKSSQGIDKDSLLELALQSLPEDALDRGTETNAQLIQHFDSLKGQLRHFSLIPVGGGGMLTHAVARIASSIKMEEDGSGDGIESLISRVENYLFDGKLAAAADALEAGLQGSEAENIAVEWTRLARGRAIAEQTVSLLQSYASSVTFSN